MDHQKTDVVQISGVTDASSFKLGREQGKGGSKGLTYEHCVLQIVRRHQGTASELLS